MGEKEVECAFGGSAPTNLSGTVLEKEFNKFEQLLTDTEVKFYFSHKRRCCSELGRPQ